MNILKYRNEVKKDTDIWKRNSDRKGNRENNQKGKGNENDKI
jgi:hypothetical protein